MASGAYPLAIGGALSGAVDYDTDTFYVMLLGPGYTPDFDAHDYRNDITANEISATGDYATGGASVTVSIGSFNTTTNKWTVTLGAKTFNGTISARYAAYYKRRGGAASADELIGLNDFGSTLSSTAADFVINASTFEVEMNAA